MALQLVGRRLFCVPYGFGDFFDSNGNTYASEFSDGLWGRGSRIEMESCALKRVYVNEKWCLGCHLCEYYCAFAGSGARDMARALKDIKINPRISIEERGGISFAVSCRHCSEPLCVKGCITGGISIEDGVIAIDADRCVGCYTCILSCPYGAVSTSESGAAQKCELCVKTTMGNPACVNGCPNNAIVYEEREQSVSEKTEYESRPAGAPKKYVIIGNSAAGVGAVEGIRQVDRDGEITVITHEPHHTYSRPLISYLLRGKVTEDRMKYRDDSFYAENAVRLIHGTVIAIEEANKTLVLSNGDKVGYDKLLLATGSRSVVPNIEGLDSVKSKFSLMSLDDARDLDSVIESGQRVLIVGAGLIGLKCAEGILERAKHITVLDLAPGILPSILDDDGARMVQKYLERKGIEFKLSASVSRFEGSSAIFKNGESLDFDILVLAAGVRPNTELLAGIADIGRGISVNAKSETSAADIYAAGDCTQTTDISSGQEKVMALLPNAYMQGECAGINMAGGDMSFDTAMPMNAVGFLGLHIITAGSYSGETYTEITEHAYKKLFYDDNLLRGYILIGDVEKAGIYSSLIRKRTPLDSIDFALVCEKPGLMAFTKDDRMTMLGS